MKISHLGPNFLSLCFCTLLLLLSLLSRTHCTFIFLVVALGFCELSLSIRQAIAVASTICEFCRVRVLFLLYIHSNTKKMSVFALLERLAPHVEKEVNLVINSKQEAETLSSKLKKIQVGLQDAEKKGVTDANIKDWLKELEDVTYAMDDVLDEWETANLQVKVEGSQEFSHPWEKVCSLFLSLCSCFEHVVGRRQITLKMKGLSERLDKILEEKGKYTFVSSESDQSLEFKQPKSTSVVDELQVHGRNWDKYSLIGKLVSEGKENSEGTEIISIVGVGGVGKTTLAQLAFNNPKVTQDFELKAWVSVSEPFDASTVARAILEAFGKSSADIHELETLIQHVRKFVEKKRFLLVLDNVWTEDRMKWECLKNCLHGEPGSRILVTTRSESVARMMGTTQLQRLGLLSDSDCATILNGVALSGRTREECEKLRDIGTKIAKKCDGLPLAARTVGSMLALRFTEQEWRDVLESSLWKYEDEVSDLFRLLKLSYTDLSPLLKRCFLSCIVYSKGSFMHVDELIRIWMAYGYISSSCGVGEVSLKGLQYFQKLAMRSFFQKLESDEHDEGIISYKMHDIMHEFANYLSGSEYSLIMDGGVEKGKSVPFQRANYNMLFNSLERIRTFCARYISQEELPLHLVPHLKRVKVLIISKCNLQHLPQDVGKLIHLRYLDVSDNPIQELPETVSDLYNLQTLDLDNCFNLSRLPEGIGKLINLRHLLNRDTFKLHRLPQGLEKLTSLWTLSEFRAKETSNLAYLRNLNQLQGSLRIFLHGLNNTTDGLEAVRKANLKNKNQLQKLELFFDDEELTIVGALQPPHNLQTLVTFGSSSKWLSNWIQTSFDSLKVLQFDYCKICSDLPPFGKLPALENLVISHCDFKCLRMEFLGIKGVAVDTTQSIFASSKGLSWFPRLKKLHFRKCKSWEEWEDITEEAQDSVPLMPCLEELKIISCEKLSALPHAFLLQAKSLKLFEFASSTLLEERYYRDGPDWDKISHIPIVIARSRLRVPFMIYKAALAFTDLGKQKNSVCAD